VCGLDFEERYGEIGRGFIHVHHTMTLAFRRGDYDVDHEKDLAPVCPNCHAMLHTSDPPLSVPELKAMLR
jgi:5-methylcytosine-specific restriction protein A